MMDKNKIDIQQLNRRNFLLSALKTSGQIAVASTAIYSISLISSSGRFGSMTAGAKSPCGAAPSCGAGYRPICSGIWVCMCWPSSGGCSSYYP